MRRKRVSLEREPDAYNNSIVRISKEQNEYFFEVGKELTTDIAEAVSMMMRQKDMENSSFWNLETKDISYEISPEKSLFWLTGGYSEWRTLEHYNKPWCDCYLDFQEEFGILIVNIVKRSKKLKDIRDGFLKYLSLPVLYDYAIRKEMTK